MTMHVTRCIWNSILNGKSEKKKTYTKKKGILFKFIHTIDLDYVFYFTFYSLSSLNGQ